MVAERQIKVVAVNAAPMAAAYTAVTSAESAEVTAAVDAPWSEVSGAEDAV